MTQTQSHLRWLSSVAMVVTVALVIVGWVFYPATADLARGADRENLLPSVMWWGFGLVGLTFSATGLVILRRGPNLVGWLLHGIGLCLASSIPGVLLSIRVEVGRDAIVAGRLLASWVGFGWIPALMLMTVFLPLLFPSGRPPSPRWWWVAGIAAAGLVYTFVTVSLDSLTGPLDQVAGGWPVTPVVMVVGALGAAASVVVRYRGAGDVERHQLKWVSAALLLVCTTVAVSLTPLVGDLLTGPQAQVVLMGVWCTIPVSVGIAITRYHLYDIDRILSRTVSYAVVGLIVTGVYGGVVVVLGATLGPRSDLTVAASTLAAAAVFSPVRRRIQHMADRRFNRPRYYRQQELAAFAQHLRGQVALTAVSDDFIRVVDRTLQPLTVALWIRNMR